LLERLHSLGQVLLMEQHPLEDQGAEVPSVGNPGVTMVSKVSRTLTNVAAGARKTHILVHGVIVIM
jgi:hypothetical protein